MHRPDHRPGAGAVSEPQHEAGRGFLSAPGPAAVWHWYGMLPFWGRFWVAVAVLTPLVWGVTAIMGVIR